MELTIIHLKHSKQSTTLHIKQNITQPLLYSLNACQTYLAIRLHKTTAEALFSFMDETPVSRNFFTEHLQRSLSLCGLDMQEYLSHSYRIGAATTAASIGLSEIQIQILVDGNLRLTGNTSDFHLYKCKYPPWTLCAIFIFIVPGP